MNLFGFFLAPWGLALAALLPTIVILYMLKLKRRPHVVPSTLLWRRSIQDMVANAPFQKLRNNLLMWLQLLILMLLVMALARPVMRLKGAEGNRLILMLDMSASMQTKEGASETRFDQAKALALQAIDNMSSEAGIWNPLGRRDEMMILGIADRAIPLQPLTTDKVALRAAVNAAMPRDTEADFRDATAILLEKTTREREGGREARDDTRVLLISDGGPARGTEALTDVKNFDFTKVGLASENLGIVAADVRRSFSGELEFQVFATVQNASPVERKTLLEWSLEGRVLDVKSATIPPNEEAAFLFTSSEQLEGIATLKLVEHGDPFPMDDQVRISLSPAPKLRVALVTAGNQFLERVFQIDPRVRLIVISPEDFPKLRDVDAVVFDGWSPEKLPPGIYMFHNVLPPKETGYEAAGTAVESPELLDWNRVHPIMRYTNFQRVLVGSALRVKVPQGAVALVQAAETDLLSLLETDERRVLVVTFDVRRSYWPLDPSFPIFFSNLVEYWVQASQGSTAAGYATGATIPLRNPTGAKRANIAAPGAPVQDVDVAAMPTLYLTETSKVGVVEVKFDNGELRRVPLNLFSKRESKIAPSDEIKSGELVLASASRSATTRQEIWMWLALGAFGLLLVEWGVYCRRTFL